MCYSAMVQQDAKKLGIRFEARVQYEAYADLFARRLAGEKLTINRAMEAPFLAEPKSAVEQGIRQSITAWREKEVSRLETEIFKQRERLANAERALKDKETKKALEDKRISTTKIEKFKTDLQKHKGSEQGEDEERVFPLHYVSLLCLDQGGEKIIRPFRYHMRPHDKDEGFDREFGGCYNARFDNLKKVGFWKDSLSSRRGLMVIRRFYENVPTERYAKNHEVPKDRIGSSNLVLCFEPDNVEYMLIPMLWDVWEKRGESPLFSAALITDDPAPEIAEAGHDRTPIFLKEEAVDGWLAAGSVEQALEFLMQRERPHYSHRLEAA